jgi:hypothetical protein
MMPNVGFPLVGTYLVDLGLFLVSLGETMFLGDLTSHGVVHQFLEALFLPHLPLFLGEIPLGELMV